MKTETSPATYRIQLVKLPHAKPGFWSRWFFGADAMALLFNLEIDGSNVLPLIRSSVDLLQQPNRDHARMVEAVDAAHGVPEPPENARIRKGT